MQEEIIQYKNVEQLLLEHGEYITQVNGFSMYPMLRSRKDPVLIVPVTGELKRWDIAVYSDGKRYIVHRVLKVDPDHYIIRGDNCTTIEFVPKSAITGVVKAFWRNGHYVAMGNPLYVFYYRFWVAINPLVKLWHSTKNLLYRIYSRLKRKI